jgi:GAF domain-containing protein
MPFAVGLRDSLWVRGQSAPSELANGDGLERVLSRHLLAVEEMAETELITSVLLLDPDGQRLWHGAAPNLPSSYCSAINGSEIGARAGSCGTAAYLGRPVYVADIASDPLWEAYRHLALPHGLRACWSTPIRASDGQLIGTFAIYHRTPGHPTIGEIEAIELITDHVAQAIMCARGVQDLFPSAPRPEQEPSIVAICDSDDAATAAFPNPDRLTENAARMQVIADSLERHAEDGASGETARLMRDIATDCRKVARTISDWLKPDEAPRRGR